MVMLARRPPLAIARAVVFAMVLRELQVRFGARRLGGVWTVVEPGAYVVVLMLLYAGVRQRVVQGMDLPVFLLSGVVPFFLFRDIWTDLMNALEANRGLFSYRQVQLVDAWLARAFVNVLISASVLLLIGAVLAFWGGYDLRVHQPLQWALVWLIGLTLAFGLGTVLCVLFEAMPEVQSVVRVANLPLYLLSGVIVPLHRLPPTILDWLALNPWLHVMEYMRAFMAPSYQPLPQVNLAYPAFWAMAVLFVGLGLYRARRLHMMAA